MELIIRKVRLEDIDQIVSIEAECFPPAEAADRKSLEERVAAFPDSFFVAEHGGQLIGFVNGCAIDGLTITDDLFHSTENHKPDGETQTVFGLDVLTAFRRQGIAAQLMKRLIQSARDSQRKRIILTCKEHLIHYYETFGYVNQGVSNSTHGGAVWYDLTLTF